MQRICKYIIVTLFCLACTISGHAQLNTDRITSIGRNALYFEDYVLAIQYFNQVIKLKPYLAEPYHLRAIAKIQLSDYQGALRDCDRAIELNPFQPGAFYTRGYVYRQLHMTAQAEQDFTKALSFSPDNKTYMLLRADTRAQLQEYDLARQDIEYLLRREPKSANLLFEKGVICIQSSDTACAYDAFLRAAEYDSQNASCWSALGMVQLTQKQEDEALVSLTKAVNLGSKWPGDYINRGIIFYRKHNYRSALADYDRAVTLDKQNAGCYYNRGMLRHELGDYNHALEDFNTAYDLALQQADDAQPTTNDQLAGILYQRGTTLLQLRQWQEAADDFETMLRLYPAFLPSYYLAAQAYTAMGNSKKAYQYRKQAYDLEQNQASNDRRTATDSVPNTDVQIAHAQTQKRDRRKEFSARTAQNQEEPEDEPSKYTSETRGAIQHRTGEVVNEPLIVLTYYARQDALRRTNYYHYLVQQLNNRHDLPSPLRFTPHELPLSADLISDHFEQISRLTDRIEQAEAAPAATAPAALFFARAMEFALVQDYSSAIDDATRALNNLPATQQQQAVIITFCRANWRYKLLDFQRANGELRQESAMDFEIMLRDYDYVMQQQPDFAFAYYNKANILCTQRNFDAAIEHYTQAIQIDPDFAEAWFNRGLTYIYTDRTEQGLADLSKAGELGIYQAYNLITRFQ